ncbi:hypothetical protein [Sinomonas humi]|nr:hypothetical protein [Sinomonas humi]
MSPNVPEPFKAFTVRNGAVGVLGGGESVAATPEPNDHAIRHEVRY